MSTVEFLEHYVNLVVQANKCPTVISVSQAVWDQLESEPVDALDLFNVEENIEVQPKVNRMFEVKLNTEQIAPVLLVEYV